MAASPLLKALQDVPTLTLENIQLQEEDLAEDRGFLCINC